MPTQHVTIHIVPGACSCADKPDDAAAAAAAAPAPLAAACCNSAWLLRLTLRPLSCNEARSAACWHRFLSQVLPSVLTQDALPRCNGRLGSCSNLLLCGHAKAGSSRCRTCCCCDCLHSRCARSKVIRNAMERDWDATFLEREEVTRSGTTRTCCTDVWLAALVWLDAGDSAPSRLPSVVAARSSAT